MTFIGIDKTIITILLFVVMIESTRAQTTDTIATRWRGYISLDQYSKPFWRADTIVDETIQPMRINGKINTNLLFKASAILSVKVANYSKEFIQGKDWELKDGQLKILPQSTIPFLDKEELVFKAFKPEFSMHGKVPGTHVLFTEKPYFSSLQIIVTYIKAKDEKWKGFVPAFANRNLPSSIAKLKSKQNLKVVFYGNSIEAGYNTSNFMNTPPYMPTWADLIIYKLRQHYGPQISFSNKAVAGKMASWGREQVNSVVIPEKADLVIIGFGMNDGSAHVPAETFRSDIDGIIRAIKKQNPKTEFILISPMLPNPDAIQSGIQSIYQSELNKLAEKGVVVADMTAVHAELLRHKLYQDMTGNNVNHPNDYLARWYAQIILGFLID
jgi:lysophospholipase L1-like esterase